MSSAHLTEWTTLFVSFIDNQSNDITIGNDGSIYISDYIHGDLDEEINSGGSDIFLVDSLSMKMKN